MSDPAGFGLFTGGLIMLQFLSYYGPQRVEEAVAAVPGMHYRGLAASTGWVPLGVQTSELLTKQLQVTDSLKLTIQFGNHG